MKTNTWIAGVPWLKWASGEFQDLILDLSIICQDMHLRRPSVIDCTLLRFPTKLLILLTRVIN